MTQLSTQNKQKVHKIQTSISHDTNLIERLSINVYNKSLKNSVKPKTITGKVNVNHDLQEKENVKIN